MTHRVVRYPLRFHQHVVNIIGLFSIRYVRCSCIRSAAAMSATEQSSSSMPSPPWLSRLLSTTPTFRCTGPHDKPIHEDLQPLIADLHCHPALEAALHLCNGDLYSAHFLVRKAQGGAKELDWGHAILHRLEGDLGNAKVSLTDGFGTHADCAKSKDTDCILHFPPARRPVSVGTPI